MIHILKDFTPRGFRRLKGYGKTDHFDPKHTGKWDRFRTERYVQKALKGWPFVLGVILLFAGMGWNSWVNHAFLFGPAVPLLFGCLLLRVSEDTAFSQSWKLAGNVFVLYAWKNVLYALMNLNEAAAVRSVNGSIAWFGSLAAGLLIAGGMYDSNHEMQSGFVVAVDLLSIGVLWFCALKNVQNMTLLYLAFLAMLVFAPVNFLFTLPVVFVKKTQERGNILRAFLALLSGVLAVAAGWYAMERIGTLAASFLVWVLLFVLSFVILIPGSIPRGMRRNLLLPAAAVLAFSDLFAFLNAKAETPSYKGAVRFLTRFIKADIAVPEVIEQGCARLSGMLCAPVDGIAEILKEQVQPLFGNPVCTAYAVHAAVFVLLFVLVSLGMELSVRMRIRK